MFITSFMAASVNGLPPKSLEEELWRMAENQNKKFWYNFDLSQKVFQEVCLGSSIKSVAQILKTLPLYHVTLCATVSHWIAYWDTVWHYSLLCDTTVHVSHNVLQWHKIIFPHHLEFFIFLMNKTNFTIFRYQRWTPSMWRDRSNKTGFRHLGRHR